MNDNVPASSLPPLAALPDPEQMQQYVAIWRQRIAKQQAEATRLAAQARLDAQQIAALLRDHFVRRA